MLRDCEKATQIANADEQLLCISGGIILLRVILVEGQR